MQWSVVRAPCFFAFPTTPPASARGRRNIVCYPEGERLFLQIRSQDLAVRGRFQFPVDQKETQQSKPKQHRSWSSVRHRNKDQLVLPKLCVINVAPQI